MKEVSQRAFLYARLRGAAKSYAFVANDHDGTDKRQHGKEPHQDIEPSDVGR